MDTRGWRKARRSRGGGGRVGGGGGGRRGVSGVGAAGGSWDVEVTSVGRGEEGRQGLRVGSG